jgi:hypothetical protein
MSGKSQLASAHSRSAADLTENTLHFRHARNGRRYAQ